MSYYGRIKKKKKKDKNFNRAHGFVASYHMKKKEEKRGERKKNQQNL
jgi:hypothetical protein